MNSIKNKLVKFPSNLFRDKLIRFENINIIRSNQSQATDTLKYVTAATALFLMKTYRNIRNSIKGKKPIVKEYPKDLVIIHQFPRAFNTPNLSPFSLKLETWCRAANIRYQNEFGLTLSSQGLVPFIRLNDYVIEDSQKCIEYLSKVFQVDLNSDLTEEQKAIARATLALCEDSLRWCAIVIRWRSKNGRKEVGLPLLPYWYIINRMHKNSWYSGYGRFSLDYVIEIAKKNLTALNTLIGNKKYLFSDAKPCDVDFAIFGICAQIKYNDKGKLNEFLNTECHNIVKHIENMKNTYWSDWNQNILSTRVAKQRNLLKRFLPF